MTNAILKSINTKDILYKILIQTNIQNREIFNTLKEEFQVYRATLRRSIREAKRRYYMRTFNMYKNDIKKTWSVINDTINRKKRINTVNNFRINNKQLMTILRLQIHSTNILLTLENHYQNRLIKVVTLMNIYMNLRILVLNGKW